MQKPITSDLFVYSTSEKLRMHALLKALNQETSDRGQDLKIRNQNQAILLHVHFKFPNRILHPNKF